MRYDSIGGLVLRVVLGIVALSALAFFVIAFGTNHGHIDELLVVTVRIEDRDTGKPLEAGTVAAIVRYPNMLERDYFGDSLKESIRIYDEQPKDAWSLYVAAARTTDNPVTTIRSAVYVTRFWILGIRTSQDVVVPRVLLIEHPRHGRVTVPIERPASVEPGDQEKTWRLDLGTIVVPQPASPNR